MPTDTTTRRGAAPPSYALILPPRDSAGRTLLRLGFCTAFLVLLLALPSAQSADRIKANNTTNLNNGGSWTGGAVPDLSNTAVWNNTVTGANTSLLGGNVSWQGIKILTPGGPITIGPGSTLTLSSGLGGTSIDMSAASQDFTIQSGLTIKTAVGQLWNIVSGRTLTLETGLFTRGTGATLNIQGSGTVNTTNITNDSFGLIGTWATIGTGTTARYATVDASNHIVAYTGGTSAATAAEVVDTTGLVNYDLAAAGALGANASFHTLRYTGVTGTVTGDFTANGILTSGTGALTLSGNVTIGPIGELALTNGDSSAAWDLTLSGIVRDGAAGVSSLTKGGLGSVTLSGANTYNGLTTISRGKLILTSTSTLGSTAGGTRIGLTGKLTLAGGVTSAESIFLDDYTNAFSGGNLIENLGANTLTGAIRLAANTRWQSGGTALQVTGGISTTNGTNGSSMVMQAATLMNVTGKPIANGGGNLYMDNPGKTIAFGVASNTYNSHSLFAGTLRTDVPNALSRDAAVAFSVQYSTSASILDLNGNDQTAGSIATGTYSAHGAYDRLITSSNPATLTTGFNNSSTTFDGRLTGAVSLTKIGTGTLTLSGPSTSTGTFAVNAGTLNLNFGRATASQTGAGAVSDYLPTTAPLILAGGTFQLTGRANGTATSLSGGTWSSGQPLISVSSTAGLAPGQFVSHANLPAGAYVVSVLSSTQFVINAAPTAAGASATLTATPNSFTTSQTFSGLTLNPGASAVTVSVPTSGSDGSVLNLGSITQNAGATVNFTLPTGTQTATHGITTSTLNDASGILGGWARVGNHWAANSTNAAGGNIVALATYTDVNRLGGALATDLVGNVRIVESGSSGSITPAAAGTTDIHTLLQSAAGAATYDPGATDVLRLGASGGILLASNAGALTIGSAAGDGMLTAGGAAEAAGSLYLINNHATNLLTINSIVADNGTGSVSVTTSGAGIAVLAGTNTFTGRTTVGGGTLRLSSEQNLGTNPLSFAADQLTLAGGTLNATASFALDDSNRGITLAPAGGTLSGNTGVTLTVGNVITGSGNLVNAGTGTLELTAANTHTGLTFANNGTLALGHVDALQNSTLTTATAGTVTFTVPGTNIYHLGGLAGNDTVSLAANTLSVGANNETTTFTGNLTGTGGLTKTGIGTLNLNTANSFSGDTRIEAGMIVLAHPNALQYSTLDTGPAGTQSANLTLPEGSTYNFGGLKGSANLDLAVSHLSVGSNNQDTTFTGAILGPFSNNLSKVGTGTLALLGNNTYTGTTTVSAGRLVIGGTNVSSITVANGANLGGEGSTLGNLVFQGTFHSLDIDAGTAAALGSTAAGKLDFSALNAGGFTVNVSGAPLGADPVTVLTYGSGGFIGNVGKFALGTYAAASARGPGGFADNGSGAITLDLGYVTNTWAGGNPTHPSFWDLGTTANWTNPKDTVFQNGDEVIFADGASSFAPTLQSNVDVARVTFSNTAGTDYTLSSAGEVLTAALGVNVTGSGNVVISSTLAGDASLTLTGSGTTTLTGTNTYSGATTISGGNLRLSSESNLGADPATFDAGHLTLDGAGATLTAAASFTIDDPNRGITLGSGGGTLGADASTTLTIANAITGSGALNKTGDGTVTLTAANTYTGLTTVTAGTLELNNTTGNAIPGDGVAGTNDIQVSLGGTLKLAAADQIADNATVSISGGNWNLNGKGETIRNLNLNAVTTTGVTAPTLTLGGSTLTLNRLDWDNTGSSVAGTISGAGTLHFVADGATQPIFETNFVGSVAVSPGVWIDAGSLKYRASTYGTTINGKVTGSGKLIFDQTGGAGGLTLANSANDYSGGTQWGSDSGTNGAWDLFTVTASGALGAGDVSLQGGNQNSWTSSFVGTPTAFNFSGSTIQTNNFTLSGHATISAGTPVGDTATSESVVLSGAFDLGASTLYVRGRGTGTLNGTISGTGGLTKIDNPGTWTLGGTNTYTGATTVSAGTLLVHGDNSAATGNVTVASGATLGGTGDGTTSGILGGDTTLDGTLSTGANTASGSIGSLAFHGQNLTFNDGSAWLVDIAQGVSSDSITGIGTLTLLGTVNLDLRNFANSYVPSQTYTLARYNACSGAFFVLQDQDANPGDGIFSAGGGLYQISFGADSLTLTAIPEPEAWLLLLAVLLPGFWLVRRRGNRA